MGTVRNVGPRNVSCERDEVGHRTYTIDWLIRLEDPLDGPAHILANWPLAAVGSTYSFGNDSDPWAWCTPMLNIAPHPDNTPGDPILDFIVTQKWTTNPSWRCQIAPIENPLLEPFQLSGESVNEQFEPSVDRFGAPLVFPNKEPITGPLIEQKRSRPSINITFNTVNLPLATYVNLINKVNDAPLWGLAARCVRFQDAKWERLVYGTCFYYFRVTYTFEFDINTFDKKIPAYGSLVLKPGGNPNNPQDFIVYKNPSDDEPGIAALDFLGRAVNPEANYFQAILQPQIAEQGNLLLLGIPAVLN